MAKEKGKSALEWLQDVEDAKEDAMRYVATVTTIDIPEIARATDDATLYNSVPAW